MAAVKDAATLEREQFPVAFGMSAEQPLREASRGNDSAKHREKMEKLYTLQRRLAITGVRPAYILNMNPYPLKVNSVLLDDVIVPACPLGQQFVVYALTEERYAYRDDKDGDETPVEFLPVMLIRDFEQQYYNKGGVVVFEATGNPKKPPPVNIEIANDNDLQEKIEEAYKRMMIYANRIYMEAQTAFHSPGRVGYRDITDEHRNLTALLWNKKMIPEKPAWFEPTKAESDLAEPCGRCKAEPKKGALMCAACGYILDPAAAYEAGEISPEDPEGLRALQRLSRGELKKLRISHLVTENVAERNERLAGSTKPTAKAAGAPEGGDLNA